MAVDLMETVIVTFLLERRRCVTGFFSKLFKLVANSTNVHIHINVIALISLVNIRRIKSGCAVKRIRGPRLRLRAIRDALP